MIKYIITITKRTGRYWTRKLELNQKNIKLIENISHAKGINFTKENTLILLGEKYEYPEAQNVSRVAKDEFYKVLEIVKRRISINTRAEQLYLERNKQ